MHGGSAIRCLALFFFSGSGNCIPLPLQIQPRPSPGSHVPYVVHVMKKAKGSGIGGSFGRVFELPNPIGVFLLPSLALRASVNCYDAQADVRYDNRIYSAKDRP
jgi:hypothetical protein